MHKHREYRDEELISAGFKANGREMDAIHAVATKEGYTSTTKWFRAVVMPIVAEALGVPMSHFDVDSRRRGTAHPAHTEQAARIDESVAVQQAKLQALVLDTQHRLQEILSAAGGARPAPSALPPVSRRKR